ncbi:two-component response regulator-like PRR95 [Magnolia sinica]|uniref:two-component response regulator-like PRR95 n=1 Tax=Magnolia sinica TaxID=86752 RepID=UPI00265A2398|nr:two-component response regulator-like PRR95 [Magnolia sinica]
MGEVALSSEVVFGEEEEEVKKIVRWESLLPRTSLGVLLVEGDDSTRQIVAALLRKCNYKVAAVSNGLKAWEILKEKPHNIDLILTEVDLPSVSGFSLLTMIMEHETCKNIPVIMMSSHDSISVVFKCMLGGAADFLVKPVRKNELRNLWQHVWRRQASNGLRHRHQDGNHVPRKFNTASDTNAASNHSSACMQKNRECSEKGSDAQSSCTKPDTEAESVYVHNMQELLQPKCRNASLVVDTEAQKHETHLKLGGSLSIHESEAEDKSMGLSSEMAPCNHVKNPSETILLEKHACVAGDKEMIPPRYRVDANMVNETEYSDKQIKPLSEVIDLIEAINNQPQYSYRPPESTIGCSIMFDDAVNFSDGNGSKCRLGSLRLELSLRGSEPSGCKNQETEERCTLNHSNASPFSRYNNRTVQPPGPPLPSPTSFNIESLECSGNSQKPLLNQSPGAAAGVHWHGLTKNDSQEETDPGVIGPGQEKTTFPFSGLGVVPVPVPSTGMPLDGFYAGYGALLPPIFYQQSVPQGPPPWSTSSSSQQEAVHVNSSHQSNLETHDSEQNHYSHDQIADKPICQAVPGQEQNMESEQDPGHVLSATGQSRSSNPCNGSGGHLNSSGCGSVCNGSSKNGAVVGAASESGNDEGLSAHDGATMKDYQRISQREAALTKFRLKRKDRCYEKKVRYQSRKRLAEQRPRVKGQFVRQVQPDPHPASIENDSYHCDLLAA